jgi:alpha-D-xyloside xylohydrolase
MFTLDLKRFKTVRRVQLETVFDGGAHFETSCGQLEVTAFAPGLYRIRLGKETGPDYRILTGKSDPPAVQFTEEEEHYQLVSGDLTLQLTQDPFRIRLLRGEKVLLQSVTDAHFTRSFRLPSFAEGPEGWFAAFNLNSGEPVFGLGEKYGPLNRRGQIVYSYNVDALGVNAEISYKNCPFAWSPSGWGIFVNTPAPVLNGVGYPQWSHRTYALKVEDTCFDIFLISGNSPTQMLERYTSLTGRSPEIPDWSLGVWMSRAYYRTPDEAWEIAQEIRRRNVPCDVFTLDGRAWLDTKTRFAFEWDKNRYTDPKEFTDKLKTLNLRLCVWEYPLVSIHHPLFEELSEKGWLLTDGDGSPYVYHWDMSPFGKVLTPLPPSGIVDFTNPEAYAWYAQSHEKLFEDGIDIIKPDFGEQVPDNAHAYNGDTGRRLHNVYALLYNRCVYEASKKTFGKDAVVWSRSGWAGSQRYPIQWGGDPQADWEGLAASIRGGLSWGMSGAPYYSHDIGGFYAGPPDAELYIRWSQAGVLGSHCRIHGIGPREPWYFGDKAEIIVRKWLEFRYQLVPYLIECARVASETGLPLMRAMVLAFPDDPLSWNFEEQYMLGDALLVAPVIQSGGEKQVYLPEGDWYDFWTGQRFKGREILHIQSPLDKIPLFGRGGKILPLGPSVQHMGELRSKEKINKIKFFGFPQALSSKSCIPFQWEKRNDGKLLLRSLSPSIAVETLGNVNAQTVKEGIILTTH